VTTSDPENKQTSLKLSVDAVAAFDTTMPLTIIPERVGIPPEKKTDWFRLAVKNVSNKPVSQEVIFVPDDIVDVEFPGTIEPGEEAVILLKVRDEFEWKNHKTSFTFATSDENSTRFTIPIEIGSYVKTKPKPQRKPTSVSSTPAKQEDNRPIRPTGSKGSGSE
jgi:hypothetical protein